MKNLKQTLLQLCCGGLTFTHTKDQTFKKGGTSLPFREKRMKRTGGGDGKETPCAAVG